MRVRPAWSALAAVALLAAGGEAGAAAPVRPVFACGFGSAKQVLVTAAPGGVAYRFGTAAVAEKVILGRAGAADVFRGAVLYPRAVNTHLRFVEGPFSYVLFHRVYFGNARQQGAEDTQGLLVLRRGKLLARLTCRSGPGFGEADLAKALPEIPEDSAFDLAEFM